MSSQFQSHAKQRNKEKKKKRKKENMKRKKRQVATGDMVRAVDKKLVRCYLSRAAVVRPMTTAEALHSNSMFDAPSAALLSRASCLAWALVVASSRTSNGGADSGPSIRWLTISLFCPAACRRRSKRCRCLRFPISMWHLQVVYMLLFDLYNVTLIDRYCPLQHS